MFSLLFIIKVYITDNYACKLILYVQKFLRSVDFTDLVVTKCYTEKFICENQPACNNWSWVSEIDAYLSNGTFISRQRREQLTHWLNSSLQQAYFLSHDIFLHKASIPFNTAVCRINQQHSYSPVAASSSSVFSSMKS